MKTLCGNMLIAHGGGPTPVINSSLRGAVEQALRCGCIDKIYGARFGVEGILGNNLVSLNQVSPEQLQLLSKTPASALGSCRRRLRAEDYPEIIRCFEAHQIRYFFYNGGNDSMDTCQKIHQLSRDVGYEVRIIGIPKTIDNDLAETDHSPGYGSAARYIAQSALELAMDAAALPIHVVVMEVMGRNAGWLTAATALYRRAMPCEHLLYLPEVPFEIPRFLNDVQKRFHPQKGLLVTVSEGVRDSGGTPLADTGIRDGFGHIIAGGTAQHLAQLIIENTPLRARSEKPGLLGRVSIALQSPVDAREARRVGSYAVRAAVGGKSGYMVSLQAERTPAYRARMGLVPLERVANAEKVFPRRWIQSGGNGVTDDFIRYCAPLVGAPAPQYSYL